MTQKFYSQVYTQKLIKLGTYSFTVQYCTWSSSEHISGAFGHKQYCSDESTTSS